MFTGIVESTSELLAIKNQGSNLDFTFKTALVSELKIDQSLCHNGVCLTVVELSDNSYHVTAIEETLKKTNLGQLKIGDRVNLERCMPAHGRFDGHIVQGHVDQVAYCTQIEDREGSWNLRFEFREPMESILVEKGSICLNGISLTVFDIEENAFTVSIIPYTWEFTNLSELVIGSSVNIEFDVLGKYLLKLSERYFKK
jgi:riboflavin synthase